MVEPGALEIFKKHLKSNNLKFTSERQKILEEVFETHEHFEADELVDIFKKKGIKISRATVYRTLDVLDNCGLVHKLNIGSGSAKYEHIHGHNHHHHIFTDDGEIIEFFDERLEKIQEEIAAKHNVELTGHVLHLFGKKKK
jgi:Fur family ferric uptake transcriptional regulator